MARWRWALLVFELFLFALILILPQVDLPDTAFRDGHTPVMAKLLVNSAPLACSAFAVLNAIVGSQRTVSAVPGSVPGPEQHSTVGSSLLCTLPC
jgi:ABC-type sulfate transport system permease subunit